MLRFELPDDAEGWFAGPWNSDVPVPIGYANEGVDIQALTFAFAHLHADEVVAFTASGH